MSEKELGQHILKLIRERKLKQAQLARQTGFSILQFNDMLHGRKILRAEYLPEIAAAIGVEIRDLFPEKGDQPGCEPD